MFKCTKKDPAREAQKLSDLRSAETDPQGSWTGVPEEPDQVPVQDADDL